MTKPAIPINTTNNTFHALQNIHTWNPFALIKALIGGHHLHDQAKLQKSTYLHICVHSMVVDNKWSGQGLNKKFVFESNLY